MAQLCCWLQSNNLQSAATFLLAQLMGSDLHMLSHKAHVSMCKFQAPTIQLFLRIHPVLEAPFLPPQTL